MPQHLHCTSLLYKAICLHRERTKMYENVCLITAFVRVFQGSYKDLLLLCRNPHVFD